MPTADNLKVSPGQYVMLQDKLTGSAYFSLMPSDDNGDWYIDDVPPGTYTGAVGPSPSGPWAAAPQLTNFVVANSQDAAGDLTPAGAIFPGNGQGAAQTACGIIAGSGAPSNAWGADGWLYLRSDGGSLTTIYQRRVGAWIGIV